MDEALGVKHLISFTSNHDANITFFKRTVKGWIANTGRLQPTHLTSYLLWPQGGNRIWQTVEKLAAFVLSFTA